MNERLTPQQRKVLEDLVAKSWKTGDDWGIPDVQDYLDDPLDDRSPLEYLRAVDNDIDWNLQHGIDPTQEDEDRASAKRAHVLVADAIEKLRKLNPGRPRAAAKPSGGSDPGRPHDVRWGDTFLWFADDMIVSVEYARNDTWRVGLHRKYGKKWISSYEDVTAKTPRLAIAAAWNLFWSKTASGDRRRDIETTETQLIQAHFMPPKGQSLKQWKASMPKTKGEWREKNPGDCGCGCKGAGSCGVGNPSSRGGQKFSFKEKSGKTYKWTRAQLDDTLLESEAWDRPAVRAKIDRLKPGKSMTIKGETLTAIGPASRSKNPSSAAPTERQLAARLARGEHL